jgi:hypothetical protein
VHFGFSAQSCEWSAGGVIPRRSNFIEELCERRRVHHESTLVHGCPVNRKTSQPAGAACAKKVLRLVDRRLQAVEVSAQQPSLCFS